jgi:thymidylate synthase
MTKQYIALANRILTEGEWVTNKRTGTRCLTVIDVNLVYDMSSLELPLVTTRKSPIKLAIAELLGYIRGYDNAADFRDLGAPTWDANANDNEAWLNNPNRKGVDDMGKVYGVIGNNFGGINQFRKVAMNLYNGIDDRGEIITYWKPDDFDKGCLRPCLHTMNFSLVNDVLNLHAFQRSCDVPLGLVANMQQMYWMLDIMAAVTNNKRGKVYHKIVNAHIYENQVELMKEQVKRVPKSPPIGYMDDRKIVLGDWDSVLTLTPDDFHVFYYQHHDPIKYPFSV